MSSDITEQDSAILSDLYTGYYGQQPETITQLAGAGSNRRYYLMSGGGCNAIPDVIGTRGDDAAENAAFISLAKHFRTAGIPVPQVLAVSTDNSAYIQSYAGRSAVFDRLATSRISGNYSTEAIAMLENGIRLLCAMQYAGKNLDFSVCYPRKEFDSRMVRWDLNYFKYCFLKSSGLEFNEDKLQDEFDLIESCLLRDKEHWATFIHRDFQSRNLMVADDDTLTVIDFQGGRRGPCGYDVASFLWQAKARYPMSLRNHLINVYCDVMTQVNPDFDRKSFMEDLPWLILFRILQTLGAYGFRGWVERKPHFLQSVTAGVDNLAEFMTLYPDIAKKLPYLKLLAGKLSEAHGSQAMDCLRHQISPVKNNLTVTVTSFSYKKGIPTDCSGNGGGFVFDCRAPHNPGRYEPYKQLTGLDKPVRDFLENDGELMPFIEECKKIVDSSVERYLQRGFTSLAVNFGCTGGQHRSVYSADAVARHLNRKYGVRVLLTHREQSIATEFPAKETDVVFDSFLKHPQKTFS